LSNKPNHNKRLLKNFRKNLRNNQTSAETRLWRLLKNKQLEGRKFRRQHSIDNFVVDFYCPNEKLVIELDGQVHYNPVAEEYDDKREEILKSYGIKVLRFENKMVFEQETIILKDISDVFKK